MVLEGQKLIAVLLGGSLGAGSRYLLSALIYASLRQPAFPYANLVVNVSGCFAIGLLAELLESRFLVSPVARTALLTGVLGGYTTFSSFAFETFALLRDGEAGLALLNAAGSLVLGLAAVWIGVRLAQTLF